MVTWSKLEKKVHWITSKMMKMLKIEWNNNRFAKKNRKPTDQKTTLCSEKKGREKKTRKVDKKKKKSIKIWQMATTYTLHTPIRMIFGCLETMLLFCHTCQIRTENWTKATSQYVMWCDVKKERHSTEIAICDV